MSEFQTCPLGRRELLLGSVIFAVIGAAVGIYLNGFDLTSKTKYPRDLTQSPHWVAYHGDAFDKDDLLVKYASYNESPIQNLTYWVGTWFVDIVPLNRMVGIAIFGLTAGLFFLLESSMSGPRNGVLASLFFVIFPRSMYEIAGGFSKAWAIGFALVAVYIVETRAWRMLLWVMPLAALTYPMASVLIGAIVLAGLILECPRSVREAWPGLKHLAGGSALALVPLLYKYFTPPAFVGKMVSTADMKAMWEQDTSWSAPRPLWEEVHGYFGHPFFVFSTALLLMLLWRRGLVWKRSWSALVIASAACYLVSDLVAPRLYLPDRYTRYSIAVLLIMWYAHNWTRALEPLSRRWVHRTALAAVVVFAAVTFPDTFKPCDGHESLERWEDAKQSESLSRAIASLPHPVLLAGPPYEMGDVMVQSRQPVLLIHRMLHRWFYDYSRAINARVRDTLRALYAEDVDEVNRLVEVYGVTHLVVHKHGYERSRVLSGRVYIKEFRSFIARLVNGRTTFVLNPPPRDAVLYEDRWFWLVKLPLKEPDSSGNVPRHP